MDKIKIKKNGASFYYMKDSIFQNECYDIITPRTIFDIDIDDNVDCVNFCVTDKHGHLLKRINLMDSKKVFPNVNKVIVDNVNLDFFYIPNAMFPNVTEVVDENGQAGKIFTNVFYSDEDTVIDLAGYETILDMAFDGCKTVKIINTDGIQCCYLNAFHNSAVLKQPFVNGVKMVGTILIDIDEEAAEIVIPEYTTLVAIKTEQKFKHQAKKLTINSTQALTQLKDKFSMIPIAKVIHLGENITSEINYSKFVNLCERIEVDENNEFFSADNQGLLYNKSKTYLLSCPMYKTGSIEIEDGVQRIAANAFYNTSIENIKISGSVSVIEDGAFVSCQKIKILEFCEGVCSLAYSRDGFFIDCDEIDELRLPNTIRSINKCFDSIKINKLILKDGIEHIVEDALEYVAGIVYLPSSLKRIDKYNFKYVDKLVAENYIDGMLSCFLNEYTCMNKVVELVLNDNIKFYVPTKMNNRLFLDLEKKILLTGFNESYFYDAELRILNYCKNTALDDNEDQIYKNAIIMNYNERHNPALENYIKENALKLGTFFIQNHNTEMLLQLLKTNLVSEEALKALVAIAAKMNASVMGAYILDKHNEFYKHSINFDI